MGVVKPSTDTLTGTVGGVGVRSCSVTSKRITMDYEKKYKETILVEQNAILQELKSLHLRIEHQTVCNDAGGNKMWSKAWRLVNEAINVIKEDKEQYKW